ncbi:surface-adhesin E family protein [Polynucleobacter sinensis]|uniref:surface-adhesin E family protein n=1 Tax=Polynucleobacter sinensis TaxID=1743157 RepID=UPI00078663EA|nr:surface-adhesin E family protein [Polynucleobacter sinensis]
METELDMHPSKALKTILFLALTSISMFAAAGWSQVSSGEDVVAYIDPATRKNVNGYIRVWVLYDYRVPKVIAGKSTGSIKSLQEFDCKEDRSRSLSTVFNSEHMGMGEINHSNSALGVWDYIQPDTVSMKILKTLCK